MFQIVGFVLSIWLSDEWVTTALSGDFHWACLNATADTGTRTLLVLLIWLTVLLLVDFLCAQQAAAMNRQSWVSHLQLQFVSVQFCHSICPFHLSHPQIVTDQQTGQKIQIVTAMNPSSVPKQQFILATADSSGTSKVILTSPDSHNTKRLIFTSADSLMPGRIQVRFSSWYPPGIWWCDDTSPTMTLAKPWSWFVLS